MASGDRNDYHRDYQGRRRAEGREQTPPPPVADEQLRKDCDASLYTFGLTCFPEVFSLEPSPDHKRLADEIQKAMEAGTKRAIAVQRGFGKTTWCDTAIQWCALTGRVEMIMLVCGNQGEADGLRDGLITSFENNDHLYALYPEITHFFRETASHGPQLKATFQGELLGIKRRKDIIFPNVPFTGAQCCIRVRGIDSHGVRGAHFVRADGKRVRPQVVLIDDPQDDDLARSNTEVRKRIGKIKKTIEGLSSPGETLTVLMPCTPIEKNDLAEYFLDRKTSPDYQGIRWPAMDSWPTCFNATEGNLWNRYFELIDEDFASGLDEHPNATQFYSDNHEVMKAGASVRWEARVEGHCIDALQSLMNRYHQGRAAFMSEFMMEPESLDGASSYLTQEEIAGRFNRLLRRQLPTKADTLTASIDVQKRLLYWKLVAWSDKTGQGHIVDYGTFPKQPRPQFTHNDAPNTMEVFVKKVFNSGLSWEEALQHCLRTLVNQLRKPIGELTPGVVLVDSRWEQSKTPIMQVAGEKEFSDILMPALGQYYGGSVSPISERKMQPGCRRPSTDVEWFIRRIDGVESLTFDANYYRSKFQAGLATEPGDPGSISFFGKIPNQILAEHFGAKAVKLKDGGRREFEEWKNKPGRDNDHWLDCAVMSCVAHELLGFRATGPGGRNARRPMETPKLDKKKIEAAKRRAARMFR